MEALCRGRPVVATQVGGITDLVRDGENGLLVASNDPAALAEALVRVLSDRALAERLAAGGEAERRRVAGDARGLRAAHARARGAGGAVTPRVLFVGPTRYELPLAPGLERKWSAIGDVLDYRVLARGTGSDERFELHADFYARVPMRVRRVVKEFRPKAIVAEDPRTAALVISAAVRRCP